MARTHANKEGGADPARPTPPPRSGLGPSRADIAPELDALRVRYAALFDESQLAVAVLDLEGRLVEVNERFVELVGYSRVELLPMMLAECTHPDDRQKESAARRALSGTATSPTYTARLRVLHKSGRVVWTDLRVSSVRNEAGEALFASAMFTDVTSEVGAEEALAEARAQLHALVEGSSDAIALLDPSGCPITANPAALLLFGWSEEDMSKPRTPLSTHVVSPSNEALLDWFTSVMLDEPGAERSLELRVYRQGEAEPRTVAATLRNARGSSKIRGLLLNARDVTREHALWSRLVQSQRLESVGLLAGGVAHDFNNVLAIVVACASTIAESSDAEAREDAVTILEAAARGSRLTKKLNAFVSGQTLELRALHLDRQLAEARTMLTRAVNVAGTVALDVRVAADLPPVLGDASSLDQVLVNLVNNAVDAQPSRIVVSARHKHLLTPEHDSTGALVEPGDYVELSVEDDGRGMSAAVRERIFEPFYTTKSTTKVSPSGGPGLGLSTVYGIVRRHGGGLYVESEVDRGSRLSVLWRVTVDDEAPRQSQGPRAAEQDENTVIIVDDEPAVARSVARLLDRRGFRTVVCTNAADGLRAVAAKSGNRTILLSDVVMPDMGGLELAAEARRIAPGLPVLLMSGYTGGVDVTKSGFEIIAKPFDAESVTKRLQSLLAVAVAQ